MTPLSWVLLGVLLTALSFIMVVLATAFALGTAAGSFALGLAGGSPSSEGKTHFMEKVVTASIIVFILGGMGCIAYGALLAGLADFLITALTFFT